MADASPETQPVTQKGAASAALLVLNPSGQRTRVPLHPLPFLFGRHTDNNLVLRDNRVSRNHARIFVENGHYVVEDLNSRHGTWVNGERIAPPRAAQFRPYRFRRARVLSAHLHAWSRPRSTAFWNSSPRLRRTPARWGPTTWASCGP